MASDPTPLKPYPGVVKAVMALQARADPSDLDHWPQKGSLPYAYFLCTRKAK